VYSVFVVIIFVDLFRFLTSGIKALSLVDIVGKYFFIFADFFSEKKKRAATFQKLSVYFYEKFVEISCIYKFLSEKYPI
jgi:hypothetical protein